MAGLAAQAFGGNLRAAPPSCRIPASADAYVLGPPAGLARVSRLPLPPPEPAVPFRERLRDVEVQEKESATFRCEVPQTDTQAAWYKEETRLWASAKYGIEEAGAERRLTVRDVSADDDAVYVCETTEGSRTVAELSVKGGSPPRRAPGPHLSGGDPRQGPLGHWPR